MDLASNCFITAEIEQLTVRFASRDLLLQNVEIEKLKQGLHQGILCFISAEVERLNYKGCIMGTLAATLLKLSNSADKQL